MFYKNKCHQKIQVSINNYYFIILKIKIIVQIIFIHKNSDKICFKI